MKLSALLTASAALALAACGNADTDTASTSSTAGGSSNSVVITVDGVSGPGTVYVSLQDEGAFGSGATYGAAAGAASGGSATATITGVTPGEYAVAAFQDVNGNGELDMGDGGVPSEPWALSNGAGTRGAPMFDDAKMNFSGGDRAAITLNR